MPQTRHKTTIEIGVDDREVAGLEKSLDRAFDQRKLDQFAQTMERIARSMEQISGMSGPNLGGGAGGGGGSTGGGGELARAIMALKESMDSSNKEAKEARRSGGFSMKGFAQQMFGTAAGNALYGGARGLVGGIGQLGASAASGNFLQKAMSIVPGVGPALGAAAQSSIQLYREHAQQMMAQAGAFGATGIGREGMGGLVRQGVHGYGLAPGQVPGLVQQFAGTSGLSGGALAGAFGTQLHLSQLMGVQGAGGVVQAGMLGGGQVSDPSKLMKEAVGSGLTAGIREARLDQYLAGLSGYVEEVRSRGIQLDPGSAMQLMNAFRGSAFQGEAGTRFAQNFGQGFGGAGRGRGFAHGMALRAAGFGQGTSYQEALEKIESRDPATMRAFVDSIRGQTSDTNAGAYLIREAMGQLGVDISAVQSRQLFEEGMLAGGDDEQGRYGRRADQHFLSRREEAGGVFSAGRTLGGVALTRQRMGGQENIGGVGHDLMLRELQVMGQVLPLVTPGITKMLELIEAMGELGSMGAEVFERLEEEGIGALPDIIEDIAAENIPAVGRARELRERIMRERLNKDPSLATPPTEAPAEAPPAAEGVGPTADRRSAALQASQRMASAAEALRIYAESEETMPSDVSAIG